MIILLYFLVCILSFSFITWLMIRSIRDNKYPPNNDDEGGISNGDNFPLIDLPPGGKLEDILVDRWYEDVKKTQF